MPTVIVLDVSLSMCRSVPTEEPGCQIRHLAIRGLTSFLDYLNTHSKLEFCALIAYSSLWEVVVPFTRDYESIKTALQKLECYDKTCLADALDGIRNIVLEEWGAAMPCQMVIVTDGSLGVGPSSLRSVLSKRENMPLPYPFPCKLHVLCLSGSSDVQRSSSIYQKLIDLGGNGGSVLMPEGPLGQKSIQQMFGRLCDTHYRPFHSTLRCGCLSSRVSLSPPPEPCTVTRDFDVVRAELNSDIIVCGFLDIGDVSSPPALSRHLVLPVKEEGTGGGGNVTIKQETEDEEGTSNDEGKQPSFCVLLHGSLKVEGMVALCQLGSKWFGMLYSWADSKKKSNLMLSAFEPGLDSIPWLGNFLHLGPSGLLAQLGLPEEETFPIKNAEKPSYSLNSVVWIRQSGLQADIQKILRHARKLPEKTQNFYKELNRLCRAAFAFGFLELLEGMATILERECTLLPGTAHPAAALQLTHAATSLRNSSCKDHNNPITPLRTKFSSDD